jgi:3-hydroxyacyl-[acyl-carrier-protein] dehydratase
MSIYTDMINSKIAISGIRDQQLSAEFCFPGNLDLFVGHFPGNPLLPGIVQIEMVKFTVEQALDHAYGIRSINRIKFTSLIHPEVPIHLSIRLTHSDDGLVINATLKTENKIASKINMLLNEK